MGDPPTREMGMPCCRDAQGLGSSPDPPLIRGMDLSKPRISVPQLCHWNLGRIDGGCVQPPAGWAGDMKGFSIRMGKM